MPRLGAFGRRDVLLGIAGRPNPDVMDSKPNGQVGVDGLQRMIAGNMGADLVVDAMASLKDVAHPWGMIANQVALVCHDKGLI